jgi:hypothetical protein
LRRRNGGMELSKICNAGNRTSDETVGLSNP